MSQPFTLPLQIPLSTSGGLLAGAKLYFYLTTTVTPQDVYSDPGLTTPITQPVTADGNGVFPVIYLGRTHLYTVDLTNAADAEVSGYPIDDIGPDTATVIGAAGTAVANTFTATQKISDAEPRLILDETDAGTDKRLWDFDVQAGVLSLRTRTDADGSGKNVIKATKGTTTAIASMEYGDSADNPTHTFNGVVIAPASPLTASGFRSMTGVVAYKTAVESRNTTTTLANDGALVVTLAQSGIYLVEAYIGFAEASAGAAGIKMQWHYSGGLTGSPGSMGAASGIVGGAASHVPMFAESTEQTYSNVGVMSSDTPASFLMVRFFMRTNSSGLPATLAFKWAQNSSSGNATLIAGGSHMLVTKVG